MATTVYFEKTVKDAGGKNGAIDVEFGRSSFLRGENLVYLNINGKGFILDEAASREFVDAAVSLGQYLGYID